MATIFTQIISNQILSHKVYEDELILAFLSIAPIQPGHVLIVPKIEIDQFVDVPDTYYFAVFAAAKIIAKAQKKAFDVERICTKIEGFEVPHFHYHLIPTNTEADLGSSPVTLSEQEMRDIQDRITRSL
jgi:histidine triad (HIT) family protein